MRQQAIEKLGNMIVDELLFGSREGPRINNLIVKWQILTNRDEDKAASVIRELMNS